MTTDPFRHLAIGLALFPAVIFSAAELSAQQAPLARLGIDRGATEVTQLGSATRWAGRIAPVTALGIGFLAASLSSTACEYEPCTGAFEGFLGGAMGGAALGAVAGAVIGWMAWTPGPSPTVPPPGAGGMRWGVMGGLPSGIEDSGYDSCAFPQTTTSLQARLGGPLRPGWDGFLEASTLRFRDSGCEGQEGLVPDPGSIDDVASSFSMLAGVSRPLVGKERLILDVVGGVARTSRSTQPVEFGRPTGPTVDTADYGAHVGVGLRAGWYMGFGGSLRMGASLRGDWIASSPMGSLPMITLGIGLWG
jgi:hypothetical protein